MNRIAIVYWSGTGNTEAMANQIAKGARGAGASVDLYTAADFDASKAAKYAAIAFGCPAMGSEELEDSEFAPMWNAVKGSLAGIKVALFGSYGWGGGDWMESWKADAPCGIADTCICNDVPDPEAEAACQELGRKLA